MEGLQMNFLAYSSTVFNTGISWYSVIVLTGAIVAYLISKYFYKKDELSKNRINQIKELAKNRTKRNRRNVSCKREN